MMGTKNFMKLDTTFLFKNLISLYYNLACGQFVRNFICPQKSVKLKISKNANISYDCAYLKNTIYPYDQWM